MDSLPCFNAFYIGSIGAVDGAVCASTAMCGRFAGTHYGNWSCELAKDAWRRGGGLAAN